MWAVSSCSAREWRGARVAVAHLNRRRRTEKRSACRRFCSRDTQRRSTARRRRDCEHVRVQVRAPARHRRVRCKTAATRQQEERGQHLDNDLLLAAHEAFANDVGLLAHQQAPVPRQYPGCTHARSPLRPRHRRA